MEKPKKTIFDKLDTHRFLLSEDPEIREKIKQAQKAYREFKKEFPEAAGLTVYGSQVKGYATQESDIDAVLYIDGEKFNENKGYDLFEDKTRLPVIYPFQKYEGLQKCEELDDNYKKLFEYAKSFEEKLKSAGFFSAKQEIYAVYLDKEIVRNSIKKFVASNFPSAYIVQLFGLNLDPEISKYREAALIELITECGSEDAADEYWQKIIEELMVLEKIGKESESALERSQKLYPQTIQEAIKKYSLKGMT